MEQSIPYIPVLAINSGMVTFDLTHAWCINGGEVITWNICTFINLLKTRSYYPKECAANERYKEWNE
jgi:hypothetical protein